MKAPNDGLDKLFKNNNFNIVIHLAAQAGVGCSLENPRAYVISNVFGLTDNNEFSVLDGIDTLANIYAATKKSNELMAHVYSHLYDITTIGLRFFTVYGPDQIWRPFYLLMQL